MAIYHDSTPPLRYLNEHPHVNIGVFSLPSPHVYVDLGSSSEFTGKPIHNAFEPYRCHSQRVPDYGNFVPDSLSSPRSQPNRNRKCYAPSTPAGSSRVFSTSQASREDAHGCDQSGSNTVYQSLTSSPGTRRNPQLSYNVPIHAPIARVPSHRVSPQAPSGGLMLDVLPVIGPTVHLLQQMAHEQERLRRRDTQTISLSSVSSPQSRYSARLRTIAPPHLSFPSVPDQPFLFNDIDNRRLSPITPPANVDCATGNASAEAMEVEPPIPGTVASLPAESVVGATANLSIAPHQLPSSPVQEPTPVSITDIPSFHSAFTHSPIDPPPLLRLAPRELPQLTPQEWDYPDVARDVETRDERDSLDEMYAEPVTGSGRQSRRLDAGDPLSLLRAPSNVHTLLSPLVLEHGERPEDLEGFVQTCHQSVDHIYYALGTSRLHRAQVDELCSSLRTVLERVHGALSFAPTDLEMSSEDLWRQWLHKYYRVLGSLYKQLSYFALLVEQISERTPRLHRVDSHLQKLWAYVVKFEDLLARLQHYHGRFPVLQLKLQYIAMHRAAREELSAERHRRREWKTQWDHERQQRKDLRDEIRRMRGSLRPARRL